MDSSPNLTETPRQPTVNIGSSSTKLPSCLSAEHEPSPTCARRAALRESRALAARMDPTPDLSEAPRPPSANTSSNPPTASLERSGRSRRASESADNEPPSKRPRTDDGAICRICREPYAAAGDHRPAVLGCGHLIGSSCIKRWLHESSTGTCPTCKAPATLEDVIYIYTDRVTAVDNSELVAVQKRLTRLQRQWKKEVKSIRGKSNSADTSVGEGSNQCGGLPPAEINVSSSRTPRRRQRRTRRRSPRMRTLRTHRRSPERSPVEPSEPPVPMGYTGLLNQINVILQNVSFALRESSFAARMDPTPDLSETPRPPSAAVSTSSKLSLASHQERSGRSRRASDEPPAKRPRADDGAICPICSEPYATGDHRPAVLKCGHLFGSSCIKRWIGEQPTGSCPTCRAPAELNDVIDIYTDRVTVANNSELTESTVRRVADVSEDSMNSGELQDLQRRLTRLQTKWNRELRAFRDLRMNVEGANVDSSTRRRRHRRIRISRMRMHILSLRMRMLKMRMQILRQNRLF